MSTTYRSSSLTATLVLAAGLVLAGCSSSDLAPTAEENTPSTHEVETDYGSVELPVDPERALGMYTTDVDILIALGIPLADTQPVRDEGYAGFPSFFPQDELNGIETFQNYPDFNYEAILAAEPDFILNGLGYEEEVVERLPDIAPTYSINSFDGGDWRENFGRVAADLDREEQYEAWIAAYQDRLEEIKQRLAEAEADPVVAQVNLMDDSVSILGCDTGRVPCLVFQDLGLEISSLAEGQGSELSLEELDQLVDVDVAFRVVTPDDEVRAEADRSIEELSDSNQLWRTLPFIAQDDYHPFDQEMLFGSPSGQLAFLEVVEQALLD